MCRLTLRSSRPPRVKICCISSIEEAALAIAHGASAVGLVSHMPSGPGVIPDDLIAEITRAVPRAVSTFLLTSLRTADAIVKQHRVCKTSTVQLVDSVHPKELEALREQLPSVELVQVIHVLSESSIGEALAASRYVDALLLDSGNPFLGTKELGGTGRVHNWDISRRIREQSVVPVFLAGGLRASNVREAIATVQPFGVDVCSGVRTDGHLSAEKLAQFMGAAKGAA